jgi:hypothetical protein
VHVLKLLLALLGASLVAQVGKLPESHTAVTRTQGSGQPLLACNQRLEQSARRKI